MFLLTLSPPSSANSIMASQTGSKKLGELIYHRVRVEEDGATESGEIRQEGARGNTVRAAGDYCSVDSSDNGRGGLPDQPERLWLPLEMRKEGEAEEQRVWIFSRGRYSL